MLISIRGAGHWPTFVKHCSLDGTTATLSLKMLSHGEMEDCWLVSNKVMNGQSLHELI